VRRGYTHNAFEEVALLLAINAIIPTASVYVSAAPTPLGYEFIGLDPETRIPDSAAPLMENLSANFLSSLALCCNLQFRQLLLARLLGLNELLPHRVEASNLSDPMYL